jgi:hypothetical protein
MFFLSLSFLPSFLYSSFFTLFFLSFTFSTTFFSFLHFFHHFFFFSFLHFFFPLLFLFLFSLLFSFFAWLLSKIMLGLGAQPRAQEASIVRRYNPLANLEGQGLEGEGHLPHHEHVQLRCWPQVPHRRRLVPSDCH